MGSREGIQARDSTTQEIGERRDEIEVAWPRKTQEIVCKGRVRDVLEETALKPD